MPLVTQPRGTLEKPDGGYVSISTLTIGLLWWSFSEGRLSLWAVRVGLALFEVRIRRLTYIRKERKAGRVPKFTPRFTAGELASLCGLPEARTRSALRELLELGLLAEFSETFIRFARSVSEVRLSPDEASAFRSWLGVLTRRRTVPLPRRALVIACESSSRALVAVILGVCLRSSWSRPGEGFSFSGRVSCSWLSRRFRVSLRAIQDAKSHVVELGWLSLSGNITTTGELVSINPHWDRLSAVKGPVLTKGDTDRARTGDRLAAGPADTKSAGGRLPADTDSAGVSSYVSPSSRESKNQDERESLGALAPENPGPGIFQSSPKKTPENTLPAPRLSDIRPEDFRDVGRALELFRQAVKCGLVPDSEHSRLSWMAAIERARTVPTRNPAGVFLFLVKHRKWAYLSDGHWEGGNSRLKTFLHPPMPEVVSLPLPRPEAPRPSRPVISKDAELLRLVREKLRGQGGSIFAALRSHAGWDRERYAAALAELEAAGAPALAGI
jgi:hypothetical protein